MWNKLLILSLSVAMALTSAAQNEPVGVRMESSQIEVNEEEKYTVFSYLDDDGTYGYYLSLAYEQELLSVVSDHSSSSIGVEDEVCLWLGGDREAAFAMLDTLLTFFDREPGTTVAMPARTCMGERLKDKIEINCVVQKKFLGGKRLVFHFEGLGGRQGEVSLSKSSIKQLRWGLKVDRKLHPNKR